MLKKPASASDRDAWSARHAREAWRGQIGFPARLPRPASLARLSCRGCSPLFPDVQAIEALLCRDEGLRQSDLWLSVTNGSIGNTEA